MNSMAGTTPQEPGKRDVAGVVVNDDKNASSPTSKDGAPPRQYIVDRCDGTSKIDPEVRPPARPCLAPPCVKWCPSCLEQNCCCKTLGRTGCVKEENDRARRVIMNVGLISNIIGLILSLFACGAISTNFSAIMTTAFSSGSSSTAQNGKVGVGLTAAAIYTPMGGERVLTFDKFCDVAELGYDVFLPVETCHQCADVSTSLVVTLFLSVISYLPSIFTDVLRRYRNYDLNCQKVFATVVTLASLLLSLYTWQGYVNSCFASFNGTEVVPRDEDGEPTGETFVLLWKPGPGLICVVTATFLKIVDITANCIVPTPSITRDREEQEAYENQ